MLSSRTKQINSYGKRSRRVVDATTDSSLAASARDIISIFDDIPPAPELTSLKNKMKKRENAVPPKAKVTPIKVVGLQKKKRLSPIFSPPKKKQITRMAQLISEAGSKPKISATIALKANPTSIALGHEDDPTIILSTSPPRAPLSAVALNIPGSPSVSHNRHPAAARTPLKSKLFSPCVDVDIIVFDDDGHTIRVERRVNQDRTNSKPLKKPQTAKPSRKAELAAAPVDVDSDYEADNLPRLPRRRAIRKPAIVLSDDSESYGHITAPIAKNKPANEVHVVSKPSISSSSKLSRTGSSILVEVLIPPAPYKPLRLPSSKLIPKSFDLAEENDTSPAVIPHTVQQAAPQRYQPAPSPILKPRQLTPIRGSRKRPFDPPSPPSPTTPTDFDLSIDFNELNLSLSSVSQSQGTYQKEIEIPEYLLPLLEECGQEISGSHNFSSFIESFPCDPILQSARERQGSDMKFRKIGEASYSEVFGIGDVVLKVIPLRDESRPNTTQLEEEGCPAPSDAKDVRKEIIVTRAMGEVYGGFVKLMKTYVVRGRYPEVLLRLWDEYNDRKGSESSCLPDSFKVSQVYAVIVLPNGGPDLEAYSFYNANRTGWRQACSLFWQVAKSLAHAEHLVSFEHRDLHWGQILVKNVSAQGNALKPLNLNQRAKSKTHRIWMDDITHGVQATVIDLGLSRMDAGDGGNGDRVHWTPFDDEVFMGEGDYQFDVYRMMKELTGGLWDGYHPVTNVLWLHYLLQKLIYYKGLKPPSVPRKTKAASTETYRPPSTEASFSEMDCYECLMDLEQWLGKHIAMIPAANLTPAMKGKGKRKIQGPVKPPAYSGPARAGEIVAYGVKKEWIKSTRLC
ncbi:hypothetical protein CVT25_011107 [Psilocybe cyanescens]|uniref:non-specific serine/threonine protein kinase n=1 Tax=Psilocybe cyanescens TaxID=93625 RepID=A0A409WGN3_PSICY|nr:hypothetical protein CVT25_011107 [Psilocybe cyanescens]